MVWQDSYDWEPDLRCMAPCEGAQAQRHLCRQPRPDPCGQPSDRQRHQCSSATCIPIRQLWHTRPYAGMPCIDVQAIRLIQSSNGLHAAPAAVQMLWQGDGDWKAQRSKREQALAWAVG